MTEIWYQRFSADEIDGFEAYLQRILNNLVDYENKDA